MAPDSYASDLCIFHDNLRTFVSKNEGHVSTNERLRVQMQRFSLVQFNELCVDVFDDLRRRHALALLQGLGDFHQLTALPPLASMHPKRNTAREKVSTLETPKFVSLCADLVFELERRFPHLAEQSSALPLDAEPPPRYTPVADHLPLAAVIPENWI